MTWTPPTQILTADPQHGVTTYARHIAEQVRTVFPLTALTDVPAATLSDPDWLHLHFTDRLWGADPVAAADAFERLAAHHRVIVTLHDVPQPSDGANLDRRVECYRRVIGAAKGVVCNSRHEAELLHEYTVPGARPAVIPLPVQPLSHGDRPFELDGAVAILGFVYPGKGHDRAIDTVSSVDVGEPGDSVAPWVVALGRASAGHEGDVAALSARAAARGVRFETTGYLSDEDLLARARGVSVPVIAHDHVSASGSLASWISAGRRPIVIRNRYMEEMAALRPGTITLVGADGFAAAVADAYRHPESTWLDDGVDLSPTSEDTVELYLSYWLSVMSA